MNPPLQLVEPRSATAFAGWNGLHASGRFAFPNHLQPRYAPHIPIPSCRQAVIPLAHAASLETLPMLRLNPQISIEGAELIALTQDLAPVPRRMLKQPVTNLSPQRDEILAALDFLFTGF